jgi:hypothetical protein
MVLEDSACQQVSQQAMPGSPGKRPALLAVSPAPVEQLPAPLAFDHFLLRLPLGQPSQKSPCPVQELTDVDSDSIMEVKRALCSFALFLLISLISALGAPPTRMAKWVGALPNPVDRSGFVR